MADPALSVVLGLTPALLWGVVDILAKRVVARTSVPATLVVLNAISLVPLIILALPTSLAVANQDLPFVALLCSANLAGGVFLYLAFQKGKLSVVSPIAATYPILSVLLAVAFLGEVVGPIRYAGMGVAVVGVYLLARGEDNGATRAIAGLVPALGAVVGFGVAFYLFKPAVLIMGIYWSLVVTRLFTVGLLLPFGVKDALTLDRRTVVFLAAMGLLDAGAYVAYNYGVTLGDLSIVAPLSGLFFAFTVVLARLTLHERLKTIQWLGVAVIVAGVVLITR